MACLAACWQPVAALGAGCSQNRQHLRRCQAAAPPRALQSGSGEAAQASDTELPPPPPAVGWLWDKKGSADTRRRLQEQNLRPKKSLGQNFMLDDGVLASIVAAAGVQPGDLVLEIGPGTGNLTRHLLGAGALVTAVEKDYALSEQLEEEFAQVPELRLVCGDILRQDLPALLAGMQGHPAELAGGAGAEEAPGGEQQQQQQGEQPGGGPVPAHPQAGAAAPLTDQQQQQQPAAASAQQDAAGRRKVKVVANLPYYITKDLLVQMLPLGDAVSALYLMLQDEVGVRLTQEDPGAADWRAMNLLTLYHSSPRYLFKIDRRKYHPAPKVHGAVVAFDLTPPGQRLAVPDEADFIKLIKKAFSQRRKVVRNSLRPLYEPAQVAAALRAAGLSEDARAQDLTLAQFGALAWALAEGT